MKGVSQGTLGNSIAKAAGRVRNIPDLLRRMPLFDEPFRFARHEVSQLEVALPHKLRRSGLTVYIRHHTTDVGALHEVFVFDLYRFPAPVAERLGQLGRGPRVLDLGAHIGTFGIYMLEQYPDAEITAVEADPLNAVILRRCIRANGRESTWKVIEAAAATRAGHAQFAFGRGAGSSLHVTGSEDKVLEVETIDVFDLFDGVDLVKMDIEGGEWEILSDERFTDAPIPALTLEYHPAGCPDGDPRAHAEGVLRAAGFSVEHISDQGGGMGMCWAWRS